MPRKTFKVRDSKGGWSEINPEDVKQQPISSPVLSVALLSRIRTVYDAMREVIVTDGHHMCLEQFELSFMREVTPETTMVVWEAIASAYLMACDYFPEDTHTRSQIYKWLILLVMGAVTDEEQEKNEVKIIKQCFAKVYPLAKAA